jgi:hypothetical protein
MPAPKRRRSVKAKHYLFRRLCKIRQLKRLGRPFVGAYRIFDATPAEYRLFGPSRPNVNAFARDDPLTTFERATT